jgi:sporulation protein YlmC with PRC-barrel domain
MLYSLRKLQGYTIQARDGEIGQLNDLYFDETDWQVRYLVVDVGSWLSRQEVLLLPGMITHIEAQAGTVAVKLTRVQVESSPDVDAAAAISREKEEALHTYYEWQPYWIIEPTLAVGLGDQPPHPVVVGMPATEGLLKPFRKKKAVRQAALADMIVEDKTPGVRSAAELVGYILEATDGAVGQVDDFVIDTSDWRISHVIFDSRLSGKQLALPSTQIQAIHWQSNRLDVGLTTEAIGNSREYDADTAATPHNQTSGPDNV